MAHPTNPVLTPYLLLILLPQGGPPVEAIRERELMAHVELLAAPELEGRAAGTWGGMVAARYVATRFRAAGVSLPPGRAGFAVPLAGQLVRLEAGSELEVVRGDARTALAFRADFAGVPHTTGRDAAGAGDVVFCGFGIHAPARGHDDFRGLAADGLAGKVAVVCAGGPRGDGDLFGALPPLFPGLAAHLDPADKVREAARRGAIAVLVLPDPLGREDRMAAARARIHWMPFIAETFTTPELLAPQALAHATPAFAVGRKGVQALFGSADALAARLAGQVPAPVPGVRVRFAATVSAADAPAAHVAGWVRGRDVALADEVVLVTAHLDGTGVSFEPGSVNPGADCDASGTAALVEIAAALAASEARPRRSIGFVAFTAEQRGLAGPAQYAAAPVFPLERTVAVLHLAAIARNEPDSCGIAGAPAPRVRAAVAAGLRAEGLALQGGLAGLERGAGHWPLAARGVPAVLVTSGPYPGLHTRADTPDRLDRAKLRRVARACLRAAWDLAEHGAR